MNADTEKPKEHLHIFVNRRKFEEGDGVKARMTGAEIASLVGVPTDLAVVHWDTGPQGAWCQRWRRITWTRCLDTLNRRPIAASVQPASRNSRIFIWRLRARRVMVAMSTA